MPHQSLSAPSLLRLKKTLTAKRLSGIDEPVDAVVGVLLREDSNSDMNVLLIRRVERDSDPWSGQIAFPGGRVAPSDPSPRAALRREVREEVGVDLNEGADELGALSLGAPMRRLDMKVQPWVYGLQGKPEIEIGPEVQEVFWVSLSRLPTLRGNAEVDVRGNRRVVDAFLVDGNVVWGFTHRVLNELLTVTEKAN